MKKNRASDFLIDKNGKTNLYIYIYFFKISLDLQDSTRDSREDSDLYKKCFKLNQTVGCLLKEQGKHTDILYVSKRLCQMTSKLKV